MRRYGWILSLGLGALSVASGCGEGLRLGSSDAEEPGVGGSDPSSGGQVQASGGQKQAGGGSVLEDEDDGFAGSPSSGGAASSGGAPSSGGETGAGGASNTGGDASGAGGAPIPREPGLPGHALVSGGALLESSKYRLWVSMGESPGAQGVMSSTKYRLESGVVGTTQ